ncbi:MAG TPA: hypothetical protein VFU04_00855 [Solirubrobacterales bacterium]|nr:hypothetical protein [Solirubrobacterales bacterium]
MTDQQASEIAAELVAGNDSQGTEIRAVARSLKALMPKLGETWAVVEVTSIPSKETQPWLLSLAGEPYTLWAALVYPAEDPKYEWPKLMVQRYDAPNWGVSTITDAIHYDHGGERVLRAWMLRLRDEYYAFKTDEMVGLPNPSPAEQFGRAIAAADGWEISGVQPDER